MFKAICFPNMQVRKDGDDGKEVMETVCHFLSLGKYVAQIKKSCLMENVTLAVSTASFPSC